MSAMPMKASTLELYEGSDGFFYEEERYTTNIAKEDVSRNMDSTVFTPEIYGLSIAGILIILGILASISFGYQILALLFVVPLIGIAIGALYIRYFKKHAK